MKLEKLYGIAIAIFAAIYSNTLYAQTDSAPPSIPGEWEFSVFAGHESLDSEAAWLEYIEDNAWNIGVTADYAKGRWLTSLGLTFVNYRDDAGFSQRTRDGYGNVSNSDSTASGMVLSFAFGPKWHFGENQNVMVFTQAGLGLMIDSSRGIPNCSNCYEEDIDINSGGFAKVGILRNSASAGAFGISYAQYLSGDMKSTLNFIWSTTY